MNFIDIHWKFHLSGQGEGPIKWAPKNPEKIVQVSVPPARLFGGRVYTIDLGIQCKAAINIGAEGAEIFLYNIAIFQSS